MQKFSIRYFVSFRLEMLTSLYNWRVAVKDRATRCSRDTILKNSPWVPFLALAAIVLATLTTSASAKEVATNSFYVKIHADPSQPDLAHKIARRNGFHNLGPVSIINISENNLFLRICFVQGLRRLQNWVSQIIWTKFWPFGFSRFSRFLIKAKYKKP